MKILADLTEDQIKIQNHLREKAGLPLLSITREQVCSTCQVLKNVEEFRVRADTDKPRKQCRQCESVYNREYGSRPAVVAQKKEYMRRYRGKAGC